MTVGQTFVIASLVLGVATPVLTLWGEGGLERVVDGTPSAGEGEPFRRPDRPLPTAVGVGTITSLHGACRESH